MIRNLFKLLVLLLIVALVGSGIIFSKAKLRDFLYREISYQFVTDQVVGRENDPEKIALLLFSYINKQLNVVGAGTVDQDSWNDLVRGVAWCDQQSWALATLLSKKNIYGRVVMLKGDCPPWGSIAHAVAEVKLNGEWRVFDPLYGLVFRKSNGQLATIKDLYLDSSLITEHPRIRALKGKDYEYFTQRYIKTLAIEPRRWGSLIDKKYNTLSRKIANKAVMLTVKIFGRHFAEPYQDLYLFVKSNSFEQKQQSSYYRARNYHLYRREVMAELVYQQIVRDYPLNREAENSLYYLGVLYLDMNRPQEAIQGLNELLYSFSDTMWYKYTHYYLGWANEEIGNLQQAETYYRKAGTDLYVNAAWRLARLLEQKKD